MAIIYSYPKVTTPLATDVLVLTDTTLTAGKRKNKTKSLALSDLAAYVVSSTSAITGGGTLNTIPLWTPDGFKLGDSIITQAASGQAVTITGQLDVTEDFNVTGSTELFGSLTVEGVATFNDEVECNNNVTVQGVFAADGNSVFSGSLTIDEQLIDGTGGSGTAGQVLSSTGTGVEWINSTSANTTYNLSGAVSNTNEFAIGLSGSDGTLDKVNFIPGTNITLTDNGSNGVTIDAAGVTGTGTTNTMPIWSDGPNGDIGDSQLRQLGPNGSGLYQLRLENADRFIINKPSSVTSGDPEYLITQDGNFKVSMGWDDDGAGFGYLYNWAGDGWRFGAFGNNPELEITTTAGSEGVTITNNLIINGSTTTAGDLIVESGLVDGDSTYGTAGQVLSSTGAQTSWVDPSAAITKLIPYFQIATPGGSDTYTQSNNVVDFDWSGGSGTYEYILPSATAIPYRTIRFVNNSTITASDKIHITAPGTETIDGGAFYEINKAYNGCAVWSDGVQWIVIQAKG